MLGIQPICVPDTVVKTACGDTTAGRVNLFDIVVVVVVVVVVFVVVFVVACECFEQIIARATGNIFGIWKTKVYSI